MLDSSRVVSLTEPNGEGPDGLRAAGGTRDGVSGQQEVCPSGPRCKELHVSSRLLLPNHVTVHHILHASWMAQISVIVFNKIALDSITSQLPFTCDECRKQLLQEKPQRKYCEPR